MRLFLLFVVFIGSSLSVLAQSKLSSFPYLTSKEKGYILLIDGDSLYGDIKLKSLPNYVEIKNKEGEWDRVYAGKLIKVEKEGHFFVPVRYGKELSVGGSKRSILEVIDSGYVKLYRYFFFGDSRNSTGVSKANSFETYFVLDKPGKEIVGFKGMAFTNFKKAIKPYIKEDTTLYNKIGNKGYKAKKDAPLIIAEYNLWKSKELMVQQKEINQQQQQKEQEEKEALKKEIEAELRKEIEEELRKEMEAQKDSL